MALLSIAHEVRTSYTSWVHTIDRLSQYVRATERKILLSPDLWGMQSDEFDVCGSVAALPAVVHVLGHFSDSSSLIL